MGVYDGVTVLELGNGMAPALAGMILADNGATVVKVEPPGGDRLRQRLPAAFHVWNRGKASLVADLHQEEGRALVLAQVANADVAMVAFAPRSAERLGVDGKTLVGMHPRLIHCSITGWGPSGPYADIPGYEGLVAAKAGGFTMRQPARPGPIFSGINRGVAGAAFLAVQGVTAALVARERTGRGQLVETSLYQGFTVFDPFGLSVLQLDRRSTIQAPAASPPGAGPPGGVYCTKDGRWLLFTNMLPHQHRAFLDAVGLSAVLDDERFSDYPRIPDPKDAQRLQREIWTTLRSRTLDEWLPILRSAKDAAFEVAASSVEGLDHPQIRHNGTVVTIDDPVLGQMEQVGPLAAFAATPSIIERPAPLLGQGSLLSPRVLEPAAGGGPDHPGAPLEGVTIVEFGAFYAMPFGCALMAALGARVIKIEDLRGDPMRVAFGPPGASGVKVSEGKESIAINLKTADGLEIARQIAARADIFVVGYRPGVAERLGLGRDALQAINPRLSYVYIAGYGIDGPYADRATYGPMNAAVAGDVHRQAAHWLDPALTVQSNLDDLPEIVARLARPGDSGDPTSALGAATTLAMTILAQRHGTAQFVVNTQIASNAYGFSDDFNRYEGKPPYPVADPDQLGFGPFYRLYRARAGWVFLACVEAADRTRLLEELDPPDLGAVRGQESSLALASALERVFATKDARSWEEQLLPLGIGCVQVFEGTVAEFACDDGGVREAGLSVEIEHPTFGPMLRHGPAIRFSDTPGVVAPGCTVGQHTMEILTELGYSAERINDLVQSGAVGVPDVRAGAR